MAWIEVTNAANLKIAVRTSQITRYHSDGGDGTWILFTAERDRINVQEPYGTVMRMIEAAEYADVPGQA